MSTWQDILALTCVALAVTYIVWRVVRKLAKRAPPGCGSCSSCPGSDAGPARQPLVSLTAKSKMPPP